MLKTESTFAERIAAVHSGASGETDVRHGELEAMFDSFLSGSDAKRRRQVEELQINLIKEQGKLEAALDRKRISPEDYVDSFNALLERTFRECEQVLGPKDFKQLFGTDPAHAGGYIDKAAFLAEEQPTVEVKSYALAAAAAKPRTKPAFMRPVRPDDKLSAIVGSKPLPRSELTKKLWDYIKKNGLQDKKKRTQINADDALRPVFNGKSQVSMLEMTKLVSGHIR
jgi:chromatin remodeling complex protein RSC6